MHFCFLAEPVACPAGTYMNVTGMSYCFGCPAGFYCTGTDLTYRCSKGHYCPENTTTAEPACPVGTYNPILGNNITAVTKFSDSQHTSHKLLTEICEIRQIS